MKKLYVLLLLLGSFTSSTFGQQRHKTEELSILAKTWGFLKYYHPGIASGRLDWDSVLVISLTNILSSKDDDAFKVELTRLFSLAGENNEPLRKRESKGAIQVKNYNVTWIGTDRSLSPLQKEMLLYTAEHPYSGKNFYAQANPDNDSTVFTPNENPYKEMQHPNVNYRLLGLFRFWNVINYFYPYKYAIGKPWEQVLKELIPIMINATDSVSYQQAIAKMSATINDSHGSLWPSVFQTFTGAYSPPFNFALIKGKAVVTKIIDSSLCMEAKIQKGSVILAINQVSIKRRIRENLNLVPASNYGGKLKTMHSFILNSPIDEASFLVKNPNGKNFITRIKQIKRDFLKDYLDFFRMTSPITSKVLEGNIGYVYFSNLNSKNLDSAMRSVLKTKAIIFDMRNYPSNGYGIYYAPNYLLSKPQIYARNTYPDFALPGVFKYKIANDNTEVSSVGKKNGDGYAGKIILLVDHRTQSVAEWACMTLMTAKKVYVIGNQTAGADGNVTRTVLPGNYKINFSGLGIYFPDGSETQRRGIPIAIKVKYKLNDLITGSDPILARAVRFANKN